MMRKLEIKNLFAGYGKKEVLHGIDFTLENGEIVLIIGPNGAGKSTFLKAIAGIIKPFKGEIIFEGKDISCLSAHERAKNGIIYFWQGGEIFKLLTVRENIELTGEFSPEIYKIFPQLQPHEKKRAGLLSGGLKHQLALSMCFNLKPKLLLLDEPSAGLAPNLVSEIMEKIKEINQKYNVGILLVEQNVKEGLKIADKVILMKMGEIVKEEHPDVIKSTDVLDKIFFES